MSQLPPPPPPPLYGGGGYKAKGNFEWKPLIGFSVCVFILIAVFMGWTNRAMEAVGIKEPDPTATPDLASITPTPDLMATIAAMQAQPQIVTQTVVMSETNQVSNEDINAIATLAVKEYQLNQPARAGKAKILVGSVRIDDHFGYCEETNIGFVASGQPYFLKVDLTKLPLQDLYNSQAQVLATDMKSDNCQFPLLEAIDIRFSGMATPAPLNLAVGGQFITQPITATHAYTFPSVAPTTNNPYLKDIPYNGPDGKPLPTVTPQPTPTVTETTINLIGTIIEASGCSDSNFSLTSSGGEYLIQFVTLPGANPLNTEALIFGSLIQLCGRQAIRVQTINYIPTATPQPTSPPNPTKTPQPTPTVTPSPTPVKMLLQGTFNGMGGCDITGWGLFVSDKSYYLLFDNLNIPSQGTDIIMRGYVDNTAICPFTALRVIDFVIPTPTPTPIVSPTVTPTATATIEMIDIIGLEGEQ